MAESTKTYVVVASAVGVPTGTDPRTGIDVVTYHSRNAEVELTGDQAERLVALGAVLDPAAKKAADEKAAKIREAVAQIEAEAAEKVAKAQAEETERKAAVTDEAEADTTKKAAANTSAAKKSGS